MQFKYLLLIFVFTIVSAALGTEAWIDFKRDADAIERDADPEAWRSIIEDISKAMTINYGKGTYSITSNNCEHLVNMHVLGINHSGQVDDKELKNEADEFNYQNSFYKSYKSHIRNCIRRAGESRNYTRTKH
ncbi:hypothetical protein C1646_817236 [Rhizophagus diaphanus]|nr:hypothetical protein C1646_817236 [Rhizophagus diaphanus] [Rhizophagus sp. MUCL 43196]